MKMLDHPNIGRFLWSLANY